MRKRTLIRLFLILSNPAFFSCNEDMQMILPGKIAIEPLNEKKCIVYHLNETLEFALPTTENISYYDLRWLNNTDVFLATEMVYKYLGNSTIMKSKWNSNIVLIDTNGKVVKKIYESKPKEYIYDYYPSSGDNKLLFFSAVKHENDELSEELFMPVALNILDLKTGEVIRKIESFYPLLNIDIYESPWSPDEKRLTYALTDIRKIEVIGDKQLNTVLSGQKGIYIYDLETDEHNLIIKNGNYPVWSPNGSHIAYIENEAIWVYNFTDETSVMLYKHEKYEQLKNIHWSPDGKYIYVVCPKFYFNSKLFLSFNEKLIRLSDGKSVPFRKLKKGFSGYTWKK